jgi:hypothetical protein
MDKSEYHKYLASREWALLKNQVNKRSGGKCERCMVGNYDSTHHITYERIGHEKIEDILAVCEGCHKFLSGKSSADPSKHTATLANEAIFACDTAFRQLDNLYFLLKELGEEEMASDITGLSVHITTTLEEKYMPALCEHFKEWREAKEISESYDG